MSNLHYLNWRSYRARLLLAAAISNRALVLRSPKAKTEMTTIANHAEPGSGIPLATGVVGRIGALTP
jgi:hypothetical protein